MTSTVTVVGCPAGLLNLPLGLNGARINSTPANAVSTGPSAPGQYANASGTNGAFQIAVDPVAWLNFTANPLYAQIVASGVIVPIN